MVDTELPPPSGAATPPPRSAAQALADAFLDADADPGRALRRALPALGSAIEADHIGVCLVDAPSHRAARLPSGAGDQPWSYMWDVDTGAPSWLQAGDPTFEDSRVYLEALRPMEVIALPDVSQLPDEYGAERDAMLERGIRSWVIVGRRSRSGQLECIVRAHGRSEALCSPESVAALRLLSALVVPTIARVDAAFRVLSVFDDLPHAAAVFDPELRLLDANAPYLDLMDAPLESLVGRVPRQLGLDGSEGSREVSAVFEGVRDAVVIDRIVEQRGGLSKRLRVELRAVRTGEGRVRCLVAHLTDTTDLWLADRELTQRLAGSDLVAEVAALLQSPGDEGFDAVVDDVLARVGAGLDLDIVEVRESGGAPTDGFDLTARWASPSVSQWPVTPVLDITPAQIGGLDDPVVLDRPAAWGDWELVPVMERPRHATCVLLPSARDDDGHASAVLLAVVAGRRTMSQHELSVLRSIASLLGQARRRHEAELLFTEAFRRAPVGINLRDVGRRLLDCSDAFLEMVGYERDELLGHPMDELVASRSDADPDEPWPAHFDGSSMQIPLRRADGQVIWIRGRRSTVRLASQGEVAITHIEEVTEQLAQERALEESEARYRGLVETAPVAITGIAADLVVRFHNPAGVELFGDLLPVGSTVAPMLGSGSTDGDTLREALTGGRPTAVEWSVEVDGVVRTMSSSIVPDDDRDGSEGGATMFTVEVTEVRRHQDQLEHQAYHDELTGLANRRSLLERIDHAQVAEGAGALLLVDLDRFKVVNDSLGHPVGDRLLLTVADRIRLLCRPNDVVARLGGDEFAVLLTGPVHASGAAAVADRLLRTIREPMELDGRFVVTGASIGIAVADGPGHSATDLVREADAAMYRAKEAGRNRYEIFDEELRASVQRRIEVESELRRALVDRRFALHLQPEVDLLTGRAVGCEALLRWNHPDGTVRSAWEFIDVAEETGLIAELGGWILDEACRQAGALIARTGRPELVMRVNLAASQLRDPALPGQVAKALGRGAIDPSNLCLEITERTLMADVDEVQLVLASLRDLGVHLAVDDFGTGFSSLAYLQRFPVDILKIDRSFVTGLGVDAPSASIVASIVGLADGLGLDVVAEGVEEPAQVAALAELGCRRVQGFLFARPAPLAEVEAAFVGHPFEHLVVGAASSHPSRAS